MTTFRSLSKTTRPCERLSITVANQASRACALRPRSPCAARSKDRRTVSFSNVGAAAIRAVAARNQGSIPSTLQLRQYDLATLGRVAQLSVKCSACVADGAAAPAQAPGERSGRGDGDGATLG